MASITAYFVIGSNGVCCRYGGILSRILKGLTIQLMSHNFV